MKEQLKIEQKVLSRMTDEVRITNILNFIFRAEGAGKQIAKLPARTLKDYSEVYGSEYHHYVNKFHEKCVNKNNLQNIISNNKLNATCLYYYLLHSMTKTSLSDFNVKFISTFNHIFFQDIHEYNLYLKNEFLIVLDDDYKIIENIYLMSDLSDLIGGGLNLDYIKNIFMHNYDFEKFYNEESNRWLFKFIINNKKSYIGLHGSSAFSLSPIETWIIEFGEKRNSQLTDFLFAYLLFSAQNDDRKKIIYDSISNNVRVKKNKQKNKQISILIDDHEKLTKIANAISGGSIKHAISILINNEIANKKY